MLGGKCFDVQNSSLLHPLTKGGAQSQKLVYGLNCPNVRTPLKNILAEDCWLDGFVLAVLPASRMLD